MFSALRCAWIHSLLALVVLSLCAGALAQGGTGELSGLVTDPTGAVVAGATVDPHQPCYQRNQNHHYDCGGDLHFPGTRGGLLQPGAFPERI
jgi:hypothetical protein